MKQLGDGESLQQSCCYQRSGGGRDAVLEKNNKFETNINFIGTRIQIGMWYLNMRVEINSLYFNQYNSIGNDDGIVWYVHIQLKPKC